MLDKFSGDNPVEAPISQSFWQVESTTLDLLGVTAGLHWLYKVQSHCFDIRIIRIRELRIADIEHAAGPSDICDLPKPLAFVCAIDLCHVNLEVLQARALWAKKPQIAVTVQGRLTVLIRTTGRR